MDPETTSLDLGTDEIIETGILDTDGRVLLDKLVRFVRPSPRQIYQWFCGVPGTCRYSVVSSADHRGGVDASATIFRR